jgi:glucokinase
MEFKVFQKELELQSRGWIPTFHDVSKEILEIVYDQLAQFLANVCNVVDPEIVVIGGGVSKAGEPLVSGVGRYVDKYLFHAVRGVKFSLATLGNDAGAYGAFKLVLEKE